jgi:hypothetical protein
MKYEREEPEIYVEFLTLKLWRSSLMPKLLRRSLMFYWACLMLLHHPSIQVKVWLCEETSHKAKMFSTYIFSKPSHVPIQTNIASQGLAENHAQQCNYVNQTLDSSHNSVGPLFQS